MNHRPAAHRIPRPLAFASRLVETAIERNLVEAAGSIAFRLFLSTLPLLVFVGFALGQLARRRGINALLDPISELVPAGAVGLLRAELTHLSHTNGPALAPLSVLGFLWMTSSGAHNLLNVFAMVFQTARRPWWKQRLHSLGWTVLAVALAVGFGWARVTLDLRLHPEASAPIASIVVPGAVERAHRTAWRRHTGERLSPITTTAPSPAAAPPAPPARRYGRPERSPLERLLTVLVLGALGTSLLAGFYRFATPPSGVGRRRTWPGACVAMGVWLVASGVFSAWAATLDRYAVFYGSLAAVAVLQLWLFFAALALLVGGLLNAQLQSDEAYRAEARRSRPSMRP